MKQGFDDLGLDEGEGLGEAGEAMGQAENNLGEGQTGQALQEQSNALDALRKGAEQLMNQMREQAGDETARGERGQHGRGGRDPLGRHTGRGGWNKDGETKIPSKIDTRKARDILNEIRKKLEDVTRPKIELDYLDRLLPTQ